MLFAAATWAIAPEMRSGQGARSASGIVPGATTALKIAPNDWVLPRYP
jgi:hypothetical protein